MVFDQRIKAGVGFFEILAGKIMLSRQLAQGTKLSGCGFIVLSGFVVGRC